MVEGETKKSATVWSPRALPVGSLGQQRSRSSIENENLERVIRCLEGALFFPRPNHCLITRLAASLLYEGR